jgi:hypothetical protein
MLNVLNRLKNSKMVGIRLKLGEIVKSGESAKKHDLDFNKIHKLNWSKCFLAPAVQRLLAINQLNIKSASLHPFQ